MINDKTFEHRPISELMAIVKNDFRKFDQEGLIDEGTLIKTVMYCNDKLGIPVREVREAATTVVDYKAQLPVDFEKLFYVAALQCSNTSITSARNPFDNNFDQSAIYDACVDRDTLGCAENYRVEIKRETGPLHYHYSNWTQLSVSGSDNYLHIDSPNKSKKGTYDVYIKDDHFHTPFKTGTLYLMYLGMMKDSEGNITFPFHPMITPFYEWSIKEKIISDALFNSDATNLGELFKLAQNERVKAWLDAHNIVTQRGYGEYIAIQRKKELGWYNQWFKFFQ